MPIVDAVVLAGGTPGADDPLYPLTRGGPKALVPIGERPMAEWVLAALIGAATVRHIVVVGLGDAIGGGLAKVRATLPDEGDLLANLFAGARVASGYVPAPTHAFVVSADVPTITPAIVDWHVGAALASGREACAFLIRRETMEQRFPGSGRSYFRMREGRFAAADLCCFDFALLRTHDPAWGALVAARKHALAQARIVGVGLLLRAVTGRATIPYVERRFRTRLGVDVHGIVSPYAEAGMDVDKPYQHALLDRDLRTRSARR